MGVRITKENFSAVVSSLIEHKERLRRMRQSCRTFDKSRANENIVALARLAAKFASYNPNISFSTDKGVFNFRTAAIIVQNGKLLVTKDDSAEHHYLPGGPCHHA